MPTYVVSYDLKKPGKNYDDLIEALESYGTYWHHLGSTWCVVSDKTAKEVCEHLVRYIDENDKILVVKSAGVGSWRGFNQSGSDWLKNHL